MYSESQAAHNCYMWLLVTSAAGNAKCTLLGRKVRLREVAQPLSAHIACKRQSGTPPMSVSLSPQSCFLLLVPYMSL